MRQIHLDYQRRRANYPARVLLVVGCLAAAAASYGAWTQAQSNSALEEKLARLEHQRPEQPERSGDKANPALASELREAHVLEAALNRRWSELFQAIEQVKNADIALLSLEPDADKGSLLVTAEARNYDAMLAYLQRLEQTSVLRNALLVQHNVQQKVAERPIRFTLSAIWEQSP